MFYPACLNMHGIWVVTFPSNKHVYLEPGHLLQNYCKTREVVIECVS